MSKPGVTKKKLEGFFKLGEKLKKYQYDDYYHPSSDSCPLCKSVRGECHRCICWMFVSDEEAFEAYFEPWEICQIQMGDKKITTVRAAYWELKRRMQHAGIKVLT